MKDEIDEPTEEEMFAAYTADLESFVKEETRNIRYVSWNKVQENWILQSV